MLRKFVLLISLLLPTLVYSQNQDKQVDRLEWSYNGFIYTTQFSDNNWFNDRTIGGINLDAFYKTFAVRTQVSSYANQRIRRFVLEYAHPLGSHVEMVYQAGRFARLDSFYESGVTNNPSVPGTAIPPNAGYSYRMFNGAFVIMDGIQAQSTYKLDSGNLVKARYAIGKMTIPSQTDIQLEAFKRTLLNNDEADIVGNRTSYDAGIHYETASWHTYMARNYYAMYVVQSGNSALAKTVANTYATLNYKVDKIGTKYITNKWWAQIEWFHDITESFKGTTGLLSSNNNAVGENHQIGMYYGDSWSYYAGRSYGRNKTAGSRNDDNFIGATWYKNQWTVSTELHNGAGFAWRKYDAPLVINSNVPKWNSIVTSITFRF